MLQQLLQDRGHAWRLAGSVFLILVVTFIPFAGSLDNDFVNWDDGVYVKHNRRIQDLSWDSIQGIFSAPLSRSYTPLTLVSFSLDHAIWGLDPFGYHLTNLLLHLANTLLVFLLIRHLTGHLLASLVAALLFGVHPLRVESVVWITERKDVLSTLFFLTALLCYLRFRGQRSFFYLLSFLSFLLALLSKQIAITLPLVFLLCDFLADRAWTWRVLFEKLPFLLLSLVFGLGALFVHNFRWWPAAETPRPPLVSEEQRVHRPEEIVGDPEGPGNDPSSVKETQDSVKPFKPRSREHLLKQASHRFSLLLQPQIAIKRAMDSCWAVSLALGKSLLLVAPSIINFAPRRVPLSHPTLLLSVLLVSVIAALVWLSYRFTRAIVFGSLFFLVTLAPTLKFVPFWADRFLYIPSIGLCYLGGLAFRFLYLRWGRLGRGILVVALIATLSILGVRTFREAEIWQDSESLWLKAAQDHPSFPKLHHNLGLAYLSKEKFDDAIGSYRSLLQLEPKHVPAINNLGTAYARKGDLENAISWYKQALVLSPNYAQAHGNLGSLNIKIEQYDAAIANFRRALELAPRHPDFHYNMGIAWHRKGDLRLAISHYRRALELNRYRARTYHSLALALHTVGDEKAARSVLGRAQELFPRDPTPAQLLEDWK